MQSPTEKQVMAINSVRKGMSARQAMIDAGYAISTANNPRTHLWGLVGTQLYLSALQEEHIQSGSTPSEIAKEVADMRKAEKPDGSPDWRARIVAHQLWRRDMGLWQNDTIEINQILEQNMAEEGKKRPISLLMRVYDDDGITVGLTREEFVEAITTYREQKGIEMPDINIQKSLEIPQPIAEKYEQIEGG